jgi:hypothetical protein
VFRNPVRASDFSLLQNVQTGSRAEPPIRRVLSFPRYTWSGLKFCHSPASSADVRN